MSRLVRVGVMLLGAAALGWPATARAQFMMFDMYSPYSSYGYSGYYGAPYSAGYSPGIGCGCAPCGCAPCGGGCATGNCATGNCASGNCASGNCGVTTNLSPSGTLSPIADPNNAAQGSTTIESRLQAIEKVLKITPNRRTYDENSGTVPTRPRTEPARDDFEAPLSPRTTPRNGEGMFEPNPQSTRSDSFRIPLPDSTEESVIQSKKPAAAPPIEDKTNLGTPDATQPSTALPLETRLTSRAVSPRQRMAITVGFAKSNGTVAQQPAVAQPAAVNVARN